MYKKFVHFGEKYTKTAIVILIFLKDLYKKILEKKHISGKILLRCIIIREKNSAEGFFR